ncbi:Translation machinery associated TMA7 domain-containing protein [Spironucleus salmonicida]|uniref:Translation machinery associated TMA7 domain-containing protein n=1 Tax=Spironucleus salmonicida TaxID=348837 RepID=V6LCF5_9EUKA|nr:Translation machinery associated TMA7 domain-containing protein [Spironucleus salmonicida]|eukprot:EST41351.1 Translation machinery associated TMA7 domain-containing protein [Spironucleus salmonicida]
MALMGKQGGKAPQNKAPKKEAKVMDEEDIAFQKKKLEEQKAMKAMAQKLTKK